MSANVEFIKGLVPAISAEDRKGYALALRDIQKIASEVPCGGMYIDAELNTLARDISKAVGVTILPAL